MTKCKVALGLLVNLCLIAVGFGQYDSPQSSVWALGSNKGLDFSTNPPTIISTSLSGANEGSASISNENGQLIMYTNGTKIWNSEHAVMPNGNNINGSGLNTASTTQASVIVPIPNSSTRYYVFSMTPTSNCRLFSNIVDMSLDENRGDIDTTYSLKGIVLRNGLTEKMTVAKGCNNNVWLLVHSNSSATFYAYQITENGLDTNAVISNVGNLPGASYNQGVMKVSFDGTKIMTNTFGGQSTTLGLEVFDFDAATGIVSNAQIIDQINAYGGTFSPKGTKVYVQEITAPGKVYQYDLLSNQADFSKTLLGNSGQYADMKLAPDGKIYVASNISSMGFNGYKYFARINNPEEQGLACNFQDTVSGLEFPSGNYGSLTQGLPNDVVVAQPSSIIYANKLDTILCNTAEINFSVALPLTSTSVTWSDGSNDLTKVLSDTGIYIVSYSNACQNFVDTFKIQSSVVIEPVIARNGSQLSIAGAYSSINWFKEGVLIGTGNIILISGTGEYEVLVGNEDGCEANATFLVEDNLTVTNVDHSTFIIYPNPTKNGNVYIESSELVEVQLLNLQGKLLIKSELVNGKLELDLHEFPEGMYMLQRISSIGELSTFKIIKQ